MLKRSLLFSAVLFCAPLLQLHAENHILAEVRFLPSSGVEKNAGVWVDGQYLGYVKELNGSKKVLLLPGKHEIVVREPWYEDYAEQPTLEPGEVHTIQLTMVRTSQPELTKSEATAELKISADPDRAAVFVDGQFLGHVNEFNGVGKAMLLTPGQHRVRLALPGYQPFETTVTLRDHQKLKIETKLIKGSITEAGALVSSK
jgi:PEGA domain